MMRHLSVLSAVGPLVSGSTDSNGHILSHWLRGHSNILGDRFWSHGDSTDADVFSYRDTSFRAVPVVDSGGGIGSDGLSDF